jgi:hypothetical protein
MFLKRSIRLIYGLPLAVGDLAMKWMLLVLAFGTYPVETKLIFDNLDTCLKAEDNMRKEYAKAYVEWRNWAPSGGAADASDPVMASRFGLKTLATCVPHA